MEKTTKCRCKCGRRENPAQTKPGVAVDVADKEKVSKCRVDQATKMLNDNPRSDE